MKSPFRFGNSSSNTHVSVVAEVNGAIPPLLAGRCSVAGTPVRHWFGADYTRLQALRQLAARDLDTPVGKGWAIRCMGPISVRPSDCHAGRPG